MTGLMTWIAIALIGSGTVFLGIAALALWRLPDIYTRLHALTKADTAGLTLIAIGAGLLEGDLRVAVTLGVTVLLVAMSGATAGHLIARLQARQDEESN